MKQENKFVVREIDGTKYLCERIPFDKKSTEAKVWKKLGFKKINSLKVIKEIK